MSNIFVLAGIESHMQPMKCLAMKKENVPNPIFTDEHLVLIKETFGVSCQRELFNAVRLFVEAGYPKQKIKVIGLVREPNATFDSWERLWAPKPVDIDIFTDAYSLMAEIWRYCERQEITFLPYVAEATINTAPQTVLDKVSDFLDLNLFLNANWQGGTVFGPGNSQLVFYDDPPGRFTEGVRIRGRFLYRQPTRPLTKPIPDNARYIYQKYVNGCSRQLGIAI